MDVGESWIARYIPDLVFWLGIAFLGIGFFLIDFGFYPLGYGILGYGAGITLFGAYERWGKR